MWQCRAAENHGKGEQKFFDMWTCARSRPRPKQLIAYPTEKYAGKEPLIR